MATEFREGLFSKKIIMSQSSRISRSVDSRTKHVYVRPSDRQGPRPTPLTAQKRLLVFSLLVVFTNHSYKTFT